MSARNLIFNVIRFDCIKIKFLCQILPNPQSVSVVSKNVRIFLNALCSSQRFDKIKWLAVKKSEG